MPLKSNSQRYGSVAQTLHWIIAAMIVGQFVLAYIAHYLPNGMEKLAVLARHKSVGMTILMLAIVRLAWRWLNPPPPLPAGMPKWERIGAHVSHALLYLLLFAMPLSGWLMSSARGYSVSWFNQFTWPDLIPRSPTAFEQLHELHATLGTLLFFVAVLHVAAALKHHWWNKDTVLKRMLPFTKVDNASFRNAR